MNGALAPRLIVTGGPTSHGYVEAHVMARSAEAMGVPASFIFEEPEALDTIHNACYSVRIMNSARLAIGRDSFFRQPPAPRGTHLQ